MDVWNVHGMDEADIQLVARTSNGLERYNRELNESFPNSHPNLVVFASTLKEKADDVILRIENVRKGREDRPTYLETTFPPIPEEFHSFKDIGSIVQKKKTGRRKRAPRKSK